MDHQHEVFTPESVDEQIDQFLVSSPERQQEQATPTQVVQALQHIYKETSRLQRVWEQLAPHLADQKEAGERLSPETSSVIVLKERAKKMQKDQTHPSRHPSLFKRSLTLLIASILLVVVIGSLAAILQFTHEQPGGQPATPSTIGDVVYSASLTTQEGISTPAWSSDSLRLAILGEPTSIWDATTGKHNVSIRFNPSYNAAPVWSPTSALLALPGQQDVTIVNGQNGGTVAIYRPQVIGTTLGAGGPLSAHIPLSGRYIGGVTWSPDGKAIASCYVSPAAGDTIQIWNPQTGQPETTLIRQGLTGCAGIAWSPDGTYLATTTWSQVIVWEVQTRQIVFQQTADQQHFFSQVAWQPRTDNLAIAFQGTQIIEPAGSTPTPTGSGKSSPTPTPTGSVEGSPAPTPTLSPVTPTPTQRPVEPEITGLSIWNVPTRHFLQSIPGITGNVTWSPDGKDLAYTSQFDGVTPMTVTILNVATERNVYIYHAAQSQTELSEPAWSPDGRYLALLMTSPGPTPTPTPFAGSGWSLTVQVWVA